MKRTKLGYNPFFTHSRIGRMFNLRPRSPYFEPYCFFVCLLICLFVCVFHGSDITTCTTSGLQILVTLCNDVRNGFSFNYIKVSKGAKIRNRCNQVPHPTQDTNGKVTLSQLDTTNESQEVSPFPAGDHKA